LIIDYSVTIIIAQGLAAVLEAGIQLITDKISIIYPG